MTGFEKWMATNHPDGVVELSFRLLPDGAAKVLASVELDGRVIDSGEWRLVSGALRMLRAKLEMEVIA